MNLLPPKWADKLLEKMFRSELLEEIQGDLHESFHWRAETKGLSYAKRQFIKEALFSIITSNTKFLSKMDRALTLTKNHLKTGWRFLWKTKEYSSINILGLSIGIVFSWFAYLYASDQYEYNKHIPDADNIYRMTTMVTLFDNMINLPGSSHVIVQQMADEFPEVEEVARFTNDNAKLKLPEGTTEQEYLIAEKSLLDFLALDYVEGSPGNFDSPSKVVISEQLAYKLGIREKAIDAEIQLLDSGNYITYQVAAVYKTISRNTSIRADLILPYSQYLNQSPTNATKSSNFDLSALIKINPETDLDQLTAKIKALMNPTKTENEYIPRLSQLSTLHLSDEYYASKGFLPGGNSKLIWFIVLAGIMCLSISIINYANFSISLYVNRAREVAVRKIIGSANSGVFQQLMTESFLTTVISAVIAIGLYLLLVPHFSELVEKRFDIGDLVNSKSLPGLLLIILSISIISGFYPSLLLSKLKILKSLKGEQKVGKSVFVTKSLLIVQFSISIIMIASMLIFKGQLDYLINFDRGYNVDNVLKVDIPIELIGSGKEDIFLNNLKAIPEIQSVSSSAGYGMTSYDDGNSRFSLTFKNIDDQYIEVMDITLLDGQLIQASKDQGIANGVIVNESFVKMSGINGDPIGASVPFPENSIIVGVIKDYYPFGPTSELSPMLFFDQEEERQILQILIRSNTDQKILGDKLLAAWEAVYDQIPLNYDYMEELYKDKFEQEDKISKISSLGSIIAIFISAFGLLGLVGLTIQRKLKELSIRRVLGAEKIQIIWIMINKFALPIIISLILGISLSAYLAEQWLSNYQNRISFGWIHAAVSATSVVLILVLIIVIQTSNVTRTNPVVHLKDE